MSEVRGRARGGTETGAAPRRRAAQGISDPRAARAKELHAKALEADRVAAQYRADRDRIIHQLRADDRQRWSYGALAAVLGCSRELIALIVRRNR
ncbi:hypothetical protein [Nocardioides sp.]|uniref:hypothetical protein n=1 Tax=Nocardioides sp. TaxID=35761 RepID=UPI002BD362A7|nr:hypothetical protein [Nocardioides sp.]HXH79756.1 hypothetical protein [Nocardioides sp.]